MSTPTPKQEAPERETPMGKFRNSVGFQFAFVFHSGLEVEKAIDHICAAAEVLIATRTADLARVRVDVATGDAARKDKE